MSSRGQVPAMEAQAARWLARRDAGISAAEEAEFAAWCRADPRHAEAVENVTWAWTALDRPISLGYEDQVRAELARLASRDRQRWTRFTAAATLAAAASLAVVLWPGRTGRIAESRGSDLPATAVVIEPERRILPDGSSVDFRPGAEIRTIFDAQIRAVVLERGEAHFSVATDLQRPFVVDAGGISVRALGTAFSVQRDSDTVEVLVTAGKVAIASSAGHAIAASSDPAPGAHGELALEAGQRVVAPLAAPVASYQVETIAAAELKERLSWRLPRLDFTETTLADAIALFNRHSRLPLRLDDTRVGALKVTGVFRADNIDGFVRALESSFRIEVERTDREIVLRSAP
jgi:transmembrane sensor